MKLQSCYYCRMVRVEPEAMSIPHQRWYLDRYDALPGEWGCKGVTGTAENNRHRWQPLLMHLTAVGE